MLSNTNIFNPMAPKVCNITIIPILQECLKPGVSLSPGFTCKSLNTHSKTNISNPIASKVCNCTNITNNTNSSEVFGPGVGLSSKTFGEFVKLDILVQFHTFEAMGLEILVLLCVFRLLHVKPRLRLTPGFKNSWRICIICNIGTVAHFGGHGIENIGFA